MTTTSTNITNSTTEARGCNLRHRVGVRLAPCESVNENGLVI